MSVTNPIYGAVRIKIESADPVRLLVYLNQSGIRLYDVIYISELLIGFTIEARDQSKLAQIVNLRGERLISCQRQGVRFVLCRTLQRFVLIAAAIILLIVSVLLPSRILFVEVEGNDKVPKQLILECASAAGVEFGALRSAIRSEKLKNTLLEEISQLQWAGINTHGCVAVITVSERDAENAQPERAPISHIAALRDGIIQSVTVSKGTPVCSVGQVVEKDQILVSGYTDCGIALTDAQRI